MKYILTDKQRSDLIAYLTQGPARRLPWEDIAILLKMLSDLPEAKKKDG